MCDELNPISQDSEWGFVVLNVTNLIIAITASIIGFFINFSSNIAKNETNISNVKHNIEKLESNTKNSLKEMEVRLNNNIKDVANDMERIEDKVNNLEPIIKNNKK